MNERTPRISAPLLRFFRRYVRWYLARQFSFVGLSRSELTGIQLDDDRPVIVYLNHPSWWDPLVCLQLAARWFRDRPAFAPMDAAQLRRYRILRSVGMFGVEQNSARGAAQFLRVSKRVLAQKGAMLWLTPQGRFADPRERPLRFAPGLSRLLPHAPDAWLVPLAIEYSFGANRKPGVLMRLGEPARAEDLLAAFPDHVERSAELERRLAATMDELADQTLRGAAEERFESLLHPAPDDVGISAGAPQIARC